MNRRGFALALVLWTLVIGAALLTVGLLVAVQEHRATGAERRLHHGFLDAEADLAMALRSRSPGELRSLLPRAFDSVAFAGPSGHATVRRLTSALYLIEATTESLGVRVRLGMLARARAPEFRISAALSVGGEAVLAGDSRVDGRDSIPSQDAACPPPDSAVPGLAAGSVRLGTSAAVVGAPPVQLRAASDTGLAPVDEDMYQRLTAHATITLPGGAWHTSPTTVGTACDLRDPSNWGATSGPPSPCAAYSPIIHSLGDLDLAGGVGQGILLVDGNLRFSGGYDFRGIMMARGRLEVAASGGPVGVLGAVAVGAAGAAAAPLGGFSVRYSKCMISNVLLSSGRLVPLRSRSWKQLF
jgi:hypothetical protein